MAMLTVHTIPLKQQFQSTLCSKATLFVGLCLLLTIVPPVLIAYSTHGFWVKHQVHREMPVVNFKHQVLVIMYSNSSSYPITWSTYSEYNSLLSSQLRYPSITSFETDSDDDGLLDRLDLELQFEKEADEMVHFIQLFLVFSYQLTQVAAVSMESMAVLQYDSSKSFSYLHCVGDLQWIQRRVLHFHRSETRYERPVFDTFEIADVLRNYNARDYLTESVHEHYIPVYGFGPGTPMTINATIRYAEAQVEYAPGFWNIMKWAWIQYCAFLLVFVFVIGRIKDTVFANHIIPTWNPAKAFPHQRRMSK